MKMLAAILAGRCANGFERDMGSRKCGHWQTEVRHVKRIKAREWMVRVYAWRAV